MDNLSKTQNLSPGSNSHADCSIGNLWHTATGPLAFPMTNDYMFRSLLQCNSSVLKGLVCALLHLNARDIHSADILNSIELGKAINDKTFILDIKVLFNDNTIVQLEMQVINQYNWTDRSLSYLCRSFDQLTRGKAYQTVKPVIQIGILDFTLFPESPEFYATYQLLNVKKYTIYSDKLRLSVLDLTQMELATEEDRLYQIDDWAAFFKTTTWEDIKMLAEKNSYIAEAAATLYELSQDEKIRLQCEAREDYYRHQASIQYEMDRRDAILKEQNAKIEERNVKIEEQNSKIKERNAKIVEQDARIEEQDAKIEEQDAKIEEQDARIEEQDARIEEQDVKIEELTRMNQTLISEKEAWIIEREQLLAQIKRK